MSQSVVRKFSGIHRWMISWRISEKNCNPDEFVNGKTEIAFKNINCITSVRLKSAHCPCSLIP